MSVDRIILESAGVLVVGGGAFLLSNVFALAPLAQNLSKSQSTIYFVAIPVAVYAAFRLYFGLLFYATKSLSVSRPRIGEGGMRSFRTDVPSCASSPPPLSSFVSANADDGGLGCRRVRVIQGCAE